MKKQTKPNSQNTSLNKVLQILDCFIKYQSDGFTISQLHNITNISFPTCYRISDFLSQNGYLYREPETRKYYIGWKFHTLSYLFNNTLEILLRKHSSTYIDELVVEYNETTGIYTRKENKMQCLINHQSSQTIQAYVREGGIYELKPDSPGRILIAFLDEKLWGNYFELNKELKESLFKVRIDGFSTTSEESVLGVTSISAPIFGPDHTICAALTIEGPTYRFYRNRFEEKIMSIKQCASQISQLLQSESVSHSHE